MTTPPSTGTALDTSLRRMLGIEVPIVQAGMGEGARADLVAAVSEAGGLGVLGAAPLTPEQLRTEMRRIRERTDRPFGVNLIFPPEFTGEKSPLADQAEQILADGVTRSSARSSRRSSTSSNRVRRPAGRGVPRRRCEHAVVWTGDAAARRRRRPLGRRARLRPGRIGQAGSARRRRRRRRRRGVRSRRRRPHRLRRVALAVGGLC